MNGSCSLSCRMNRWNGYRKMRNCCSNGYTMMSCYSNGCSLESCWACCSSVNCSAGCNSESCQTNAGWKELKKADYTWMTCFQDWQNGWYCLMYLNWYRNTKVCSALPLSWALNIQVFPGEL